MTQHESEFIRQLRVWLLGFASTLIVITAGSIINSHYQVKRLTEVVEDIKTVKMDKTTFNYYMELMDDRSIQNCKDHDNLQKAIEEIKKYKFVERGIKN